MNQNHVIVAFDNDLTNLVCNWHECRAPFRQNELRVHRIEATQTEPNLRDMVTQAIIPAPRAVHSLYHKQCYDRFLNAEREAFESICRHPGVTDVDDMPKRHARLMKLYTRHSNHADIEMELEPVLQTTHERAPSAVITVRFSATTPVLDLPIYDFTDWTPTQLGHFFRRMVVVDLHIIDHSLTERTDSHIEAMALFTTAMKRQKIDCALIDDQKHSVILARQEVGAQSTDRERQIVFSLRFVFCLGMSATHERDTLRDLLEMCDDAHTPSWADFNPLVATSTEFERRLAACDAALDKEQEAVIASIRNAMPLPASLSQDNIEMRIERPVVTRFSTVTEARATNSIHIWLNAQPVPSQDDYYLLRRDTPTASAAASAAAGAAAASSSTTTTTQIVRVKAHGRTPGLPCELVSYQTDIRDILSCASGHVEVSANPPITVKTIGVL